MDPAKILDSVRDAVSARRVFGDPVEREGVTLVPAATVIGGGGGGVSEGGEGQPNSGLGYGLIGWASGAYEIKDGRARWVPSVDLNPLLLLALVVLAGLLQRRRG